MSYVHGHAGSMARHQKLVVSPQLNLNGSIRYLNLDWLSDLNG